MQTRIFFRENGNIREEFDINVKNLKKDYWKEYILNMSEDIIFIDLDIKKIRPYVKYLLNSKAEDIKDTFVLIILIVSIIGALIGFFNFKNFSTFKEQFAVQTKELVKKVDNKEVIKNTLESPDIRELKESQFKKEIDKQKGGWGY